jgi:hypothetical protein
MTSFILSIIACTFMILELRQKLKIDSISLTNSDKTSNITGIPFPAVTIMGGHTMGMLDDIAAGIGIESEDFTDYFENDEFQLQ